MQLAEYLFARLKQLGVHDVLGVPGDYNLTLLDYVVPAGLNWIGNCNELNAAYAADGYARIRGLSALVTTYGVGELSAANGIAGAYAERAPVVHIVGSPALSLVASKHPIHHTFIDGEFDHFARMAKEITVAQVCLNDPTRAAEQVDYALQQCLYHSRPVYIQVPTDQLEVEVDKSRLGQPVVADTGKDQSSFPETDAVNIILARIYSASKVLLYVDGESRSMGIKAELNELARATGLPTFSTPFGKGIVDETLPNAYGIYTAKAGPQDYSEDFAQSDLILSFGPHLSTTNSYNLRTLPDKKKTIFFRPHQITFCSPDGAVEGKLEHLHIKSLLSKLASTFDASKLSSPNVLDRLTPKSVRSRPTNLSADVAITQEIFYPAVQPILKPGDVVLGETGTPAYGTRELALPAGCAYIGATTWLSIGYMLPATLGAALARRTSVAAGEHGRCVLFTGDGSLQMTVQEMSTIIHNDLDVLVFVINNSGYTIERCLHGWRAAYNDVAPWRYAEASSFFGAPEARRRGWTVRTVGELTAVLQDPQVMQGGGLRVVEVIMDKEDAPETLLGLTSRPPPKDA